jgi:hypothetical protein
MLATLKQLLASLLLRRNDHSVESMNLEIDEVALGTYLDGSQ